jgi:hypothetical protein
MRRAGVLRGKGLAYWVLFGCYLGVIGVLLPFVHFTPARAQFLTEKAPRINTFSILEWKKPPREAALGRTV